ncbi:MAG: bifunctional (p)ppGpp synthetase/guanosine-3',5'-bis(diphosphate) 3'-pyrophosphohydrolase [Candidatus Kaiserbacteria bacterium]|nr:bifunctional (p)ppGpp synthetase/guanosine-3',5'-bis(diphosphate) 3'-pyrophosphohydrolase [Candidatus Kaiserbacteria bacterium]MCB9816006.1 bifunctional (p)ppGpp synthetase/guanosine-3',5'-bis(diphosphate) 3'-pyrophosphohydrolase [Candidatus Nomurabacteria bacterium]
MYTYKIEQAIKAAALLHQDQLRKGDIGLPYITHLMAVMMILRDYTTDEDTLVAALLHDTLEDTDYTIEELQEDFGKTVAQYVETVTEQRNESSGKLEWAEIKKAYAKQLKKGPEQAVMIAAADKIHNLRSMVEDYYDNHDGFLREFGTNLDSRLEAYQSIANAINSRISDGIVHEFNNTFSAYKEFLLDVQESLN